MKIIAAEKSKKNGFLQIMKKIRLKKYLCYFSGKTGGNLSPECFSLLSGLLRIGIDLQD